MEPDRDDGDRGGVQVSAEQKSDLYYAVNEMMAHLGCHGEIDTRHKAVRDVMVELARIDRDCPDYETAINASRYLHLRSKSLDTIGDGGVFAGLTPKNVVLNGQDLDEAIDRERIK